MDEKRRNVHKANSPPGVAVRLAASMAIADVLGAGLTLNMALEHRTAKFKDSRDLALIKEITYGVLRILPRLRGYAAKLMTSSSKLKDLEIECLLLVGLYQLAVLRIPDHAAVAETVAVAKQLNKPWATGFLNAVLRNFIRQPEILSYRATEHCFPEWLATALKHAWPDQVSSIMLESDKHPPMVVRVNLARITCVAYRELLQSVGISAEPLEYAPAALVLKQPVDVAILPGFADGLVSVQDGAAQLAVPLLNITPGNQVLDACAAPGGKTGQLLENYPDIKLTVVDVDATRLARLIQGLERLKVHKPRIFTADLTTTSPSPLSCQVEGRGGVLYDRILLDVPCSATGVIRRHPDIKWLRHPTDITTLATTQGLILDNLWAKLNKNGTLLYVTCSLLPEENYELILAFLRRTPEARELSLNVSWGHPCPVGRQILPGEHGMDGFYFARLIRGVEALPP